MKRVLPLLLGVSAAAVIGVTPASAAATALPPCKMETMTMRSVGYWGTPGPTYRLTQTDCIIPRPKACLKVEIIAPVVAVLYESCSPTSARLRRAGFSRF